MNGKINIVLIAFGLFLVMGCALVRKFNPITEGKPYLTPIPQATINAFKFGKPITNKLDAVIAANYMTSSPSIVPVGSPVAIFVEELKLRDAYKRVEQTDQYESRSGGSLVWLVAFEGDWEMTPPGSDSSRTFNGCIWVILNAGDGNKILSGGVTCDLWLKE